MRRIFVLLIIGALVVQPARLAAQQSHHWSLAVTASLTGFRGGVSDTALSGEVVVRPGQGVALGIAVTREWARWTLSLGISHLPTHVEAISRDVAVQARADGLDRVRIAALVGRRLAQIGTGRLDVRAGPALDHWSAGGDAGRAVAGGEVQLALQIPVGPAAVENVIGFGWSAGPFQTHELPAEYRREGLRTITVGIGARFKV